ncbi:MULTISPECIES: single-stranded DNA-binding protein [Mumia]|uniref:single-stranded DNA-binding protein n=1 Tax=Mumia TaxID=1546255 RepID=UPI0014240EBC|nr:MULTISPECIES: single-stranded DNA-binding protein [unclassified Mumia]QMW65246.1 single-stranded DNA-binding protein [Mumia sp. ZJ1417]
MSDNQMTVYGNLGTPVDYRESKGFGWAMFRVGSTPRFFDRQQGRWRDLETVWITVKASRTLAQNVAASLKTGDPVVVIGRLRSHTWEDKDTREQHQRDVLEATAVCHDLNRGTSTFTRNEPAAVQEQASSDGEAVAEFESSHTAPAPGARAEPVAV